MPRHHHLREKPQQLTEPPAAPRRLLERRRGAGKVKSLGISPPRGGRTPRPLSSSSWTWGNLSIRDRSRPGAAAPSAAGGTNGHHPDERAGGRAGGRAHLGRTAHLSPEAPQSPPLPPSPVRGHRLPHLPSELLALPASPRPFAAPPYFTACAQDGGRIG